MIFKIDVASVLSDLKKYHQVLNKFNFNKETKTIIINDLEQLIQLQTLIGETIMLHGHSINIYDNFIE